VREQQRPGLKSKSARPRSEHSAPPRPDDPAGGAARAVIHASKDNREGREEDSSEGNDREGREEDSSEGRDRQGCETIYKKAKRARKIHHLIYVT
jgi:hypothetical protein